MTPAGLEWKKWVPVGLVAAALLALGGCGGTTTPVNGEPAGSGQPTITEPAEPVGPAATVAFAALPTGTLTPVAEASIFDTAELWIVADWKGAPADGAERVVITTPEGTLFQSTEISFAEAARGDVRIQVLSDGTRRVALALQIWGTSIEQLSRRGTWSAAVTLVGGEAGGSASVDLRE
jgi:hypothetical protein